jgi:hypothetical protein
MRDLGLAAGFSRPESFESLVWKKTECHIEWIHQGIYLIAKQYFAKMTSTKSFIQAGRSSP